ncbi:similar to Saccharomyces cerevisiae YHR184W SSP1 Protein involved in the control of meiotic nuclear division and coordination of meiosis with spore formation [Maudiozyma saulgeensis]|uniref:Similar to Saccharomyces cerevisiae YHR184W SSP1 Protein involved in the control of meiotic nuclear division and coordination of meiosis with spore formation n=1 Tax=Maudiozyma saulgeensis TaxID=1789683 RepID=A0A1X7RB73_9SACH|nr:similar to Saccharomyces cerevisiae YHR184W SSP1 Protein involved in the control of meiotic nuclear division and coordination of meiosis with spore formation [Kazachstania saulgeensis]
MQQLYDQYDLPSLTNPQTMVRQTETPKKLVNKMKQWFNQSILKTPLHGYHHRDGDHDDGDGGVDSLECSPKTDLNDAPLQSFPATPIRNNGSNGNHFDDKLQLVEDNKIQSASMGDPQFLEYSLLSFHGDLQMNNDSTKFFSSQIANHLKFKTISSNKLRKRLDMIANKKQNEVKYIKKFITDINHWSNIPLFQNDINDTHLVIRQITTLFSQDVQYQENIIKQLKAIVNDLEYVALKENDLINDHKKLIQEHKRYNNIKLKKGINHPETSFSLERVITAEHLYESMKVSFQKIISITMRQLFQDLSYEYYSNSEDMKIISSSLIKEFMMSLESHNFQKFNNQLEQLKRKRNEKVWSQFSIEDKQNPIKWENIKSGIYEKNDSLLQDIYKNLPNDHYSKMSLRRVNSFPADTFLKSNLEDIDTTIDCGFILNKNTNDNGIESHKSLSDKYNPMSTNTFLSQPKIDKDIFQPSSSATVIPTLKIVDTNIDANETFKAHSTTKLKSQNLNSYNLPNQLISQETQNITNAIGLLDRNDYSADIENNHWENEVGD